MDWILGFIVYEIRDGGKYRDGVFFFNRFSVIIFGKKYFFVLFLKWLLCINNGFVDFFFFIR